MSESQMREVLAELQSLLDDVEALLTMVQGAPMLASPARENAREMLRRLRGRLRDEHKRTSTVKGRAGLNLVERNYYTPAVQEADDDLRIRIDSPPGDAWIGDLLSARLDIETLARQLRDALAASR
jgi:ElaB/YqjD/DUF883 family membrane-anchored ribosome-binding protein